MRRIITGFAGVVLAMSLLAGCSAQDSLTEVTTAQAKAGKDLSAMVWQGTVEPMSTVEVVPSSNGKVVAVEAKEGQEVKKGDVLFKLDDTDAGLSLKQAQASYQAAEISHNNASQNFNRISALYGSGSVSQADYGNAKVQRDSTGAQMASAKAGLDIAQKRFDDCTVTSPIKGLVTSVKVDVGQTVSPQAAAVTVIDNSQEKVELQVADMDIDLLSKGLPMEVNLQATGTSCKGQISDISSVCDPKTGMYTVKVQIQPGEKTGYIGLGADVRVSGSEKSKSVYVPAKCIFSDDSGSYVYLVKNGTAVKTPVTTGRKKNAYMEVTGGLAEGDGVVFQSSRQLADGMQVRVLSVK